MDFLKALLHLDQFLIPFFQQFGLWAFLILFIILFLETGLILTPFLPGDSLLFSLGTILSLASHHPSESYLNLDLNLGSPNILFHSPFLWSCILILAVFLGDNANYLIGRYLGPKFFQDYFSGTFLKFLFRHENLKRTHFFFEKHGVKSIVLARFIPIVRTFMPCVAGVGKMPYLFFLLISLIAACLWVFSLIYLGYFFGNLPWIKKYFSLAVLGIIFISVLPMLIQAVIIFLKKIKIKI